MLNLKNYYYPELTLFHVENKSTTDSRRSREHSSRTINRKFAPNRFLESIYRSYFLNDRNNGTHEIFW